MNFNGRDLSIYGADRQDPSYKNELLFAYYSISFIILKLFSLKILTFKKFKHSFKSKQIVDIELLFIIIVALYVVNYNYFKGIQLYISYIFIIAHLNLLSNFIFKKKDTYANV